MSRDGAPRVGVFGIGLAAYWPQFDGLRDRLAGYQGGIEERLAGMGADVVSAGLVDSAQAARQAGEKFEDDGTGAEKVVAFLEQLKVV